MPDQPSRHDLGGFIAELKRRRVVRVALAYLVVAWLAIEIADTVFPNLGLPAWSVRLVILLAALGLIPTVLLAWVFDITSTGIERTDPRNPNLRRPRAAVVAAVLIAVAAPLGGWFALTSDDDVFVDSRLAILPFRVSGAGPELAHLREGLPDLLVATLGSDSLLATLPSRTVLAALERREARESDLLDEIMGDVARELGSGRLLTGEIVSRGAAVEVVASLVDGRTGNPIETVRAAAPADSLHQLVDRLSNQLVAVVGGTPRHRLAAVTSTSRHAVEQYLRGAALFRGGRYEDAAHHFRQAVASDSTFALASFYLYNSLIWSAQEQAPGERTRMAHLAARYKANLGAQDLVHFEARLGTYYPDSLHPLAEIVELRERAARLYPQNAEIVYDYADGLFHYGGLAGRDNFLEESRAWFERALALDPTYPEPLEHAASLAILRDDTAAFRRYSDALIAIDSTGPTALVHRWVRDKVLGSARPVTASRIIVEFGPASILDLYWKAMSDAVGVADLADALDTIGETRTREYDYIAHWLAVIEGRPAKLDSLEQIAGLATWDAGDIWKGLYWTHDSAATAVAVEAVVRDTAFRPQEWMGCLAAVHFARIGNTTRARAIGERAFADDSAASAYSRREHRVCRQLTETIIAQRGDRSTALQALRSFDALMRTVPRIGWLREQSNVELARMWEAQGNLERALNAWLRIEIQNPGLLYADRLAEAGRIAERLGDRETAVWAYATHLRLRSRPEGIFDERSRIVRERLEVLNESRR